MATLNFYNVLIGSEILKGKDTSHLPSWIFEQGKIAISKHV